MQFVDGVVEALQVPPEPGGALDQEGAVQHEKGLGRDGGVVPPANGRGGVRKIEEGEEVVDVAAHDGEVDTAMGILFVGAQVACEVLGRRVLGLDLGRCVRRTALQSGSRSSIPARTLCRPARRPSAEWHRGDRHTERSGFAVVH